MIEVIVSRFFPYESTDPDNPGTIHGAMVLGRFYCSQECYDKLKLVLEDKKTNESVTHLLSGLIRGL